MAQRRRRQSAVAAAAIIAIAIIIKGSGQTILEIEVRGKRGVGYCKSTAGAVRPFKRLKARLRP
jgi:hypothetical protein